MALSLSCRRAASQLFSQRQCRVTKNAIFESRSLLTRHLERNLVRRAQFGTHPSHCLSSSATAAPKASNSLGGFSFPGPRKLKDVVKLPLLNAHGAPRVTEIWLEYHKHHATTIADVLNADEHETFMQRTQRCPTFVLPVPRREGYFTLFIQFQGSHCLMTYLEDYKTNPAAAQPYVALTIFDELVQKKGLALLRGEVTNRMTREEAQRIWHLIRQFYLGSRALYDQVVSFNENSTKFDFRAVLRASGIAS